MNEDKITFFAQTNFRNQRVKFGIKARDRRNHMYIIGRTGMGKTTLLENMAIQDIQNGHGLGIVDPHGEFAEKMLNFVPSHRINDVIYFDPADLDYPIAFNIIERVGAHQRHLVASGLMGVFKKIWPDVWSARMEYLLYNSIMALLEYPGSTLLGINRLLADKEYRQKVVEKITDPSIKSFWVNEFAKYPDKFREEAVAPIQNKVGQFISAPLIRNIIGQTVSAIDMREVMDKGKILILNLSKGRIGEDASRLLGALLITKLQLAAMSRVDLPEEERRDFYLYVDEFQNFATEAFATILSEARKYHLCLILAHQYIAQMDEQVRDAVFGNVGTLITFRVGAADAEFLEKEFFPEFTMNDIVNLDFASIYLKLMIDGIVSKPFSATTLPPFPLPSKSHKEKIIRLSREQYGTPRKVVEEKIAKWAGAFLKEETAKKKKLYPAKCTLCGKDTEVVFKPKEGLPVYCPTCLKKVKGEKKTETAKEKRAQTIFQPGEPVVRTDNSQYVSLKEITKKATDVSSKTDSSETKKTSKRKKEVNLAELRRILEESLALTQQQDTKGGEKNEA